MIVWTVNTQSCFLVRRVTVHFELMPSHDIGPLHCSMWAQSYALPVMAIATTFSIGKSWPVPYYINPEILLLYTLSNTTKRFSQS